MLAEVLPCFPPGLHGALRQGWNRLDGDVEEIRLRQGQPLHLVGAAGERLEGYVATREDLGRTFQLLCQSSVYAWEEQIRGAFLTVQGGHRAGLCGRAVVEGGRLKTIQPVSSICLRIAREVQGAARPLLQRLQSLPATLIASPPGAGKTTLLRDLVRSLSAGDGLPPRRVAVVDERSEIAACLHGVPQRDVGPRTDVLDGCPKAEGAMLLVRAMSPQVLAMDEVGSEAEAEALLTALSAGVTVLATAHGASLAELRRRPGLRELLSAGAFARLVLLSRRRGPGTIEEVIDLTCG